MSVGQSVGSWSGVCSGSEGDMVQMAVAAWREKGACTVEHAQRSSASRDSLTFRCDWCKQTVDRSLNVRTTGMSSTTGLKGAISAGDKCCAGVWWHEDGDEIALCCLCFHVPDPGFTLFSLVSLHNLLLDSMRKLLVPAEIPPELIHAESSHITVSATVRSPAYVNEC